MFLFFSRQIFSIDHQPGIAVRLRCERYVCLNHELLDNGCQQILTDPLVGSEIMFAYPQLRCLVLFSVMQHTISVDVGGIRCEIRNFFTWIGIHGNGSIIRMIDQAVPVSSCERVCRLYAECVGFNVNWTDIGKEIGFCSFVNSHSEWIEPEITRSELAFYGRYNFQEKESLLLLLLFSLILLNVLLSELLSDLMSEPVSQ